MVDNKDSPQGSERAQSEMPCRYASPEWAVVIVGIVTFIAILYQGVKTKDAAEATQASAEATRIAADIAKASSDALINIERARIHPLVLIEPRNLLELARENSPNAVEISVRLNNIGRTQAWVTGWCFNTLVSPTRRVIPFEYKGINEGAGYWIAAGAGENLYADFSVPGFTYIDEIWEGTFFLYAYGFLKYRDIFQRADEPAHETYFSRRYTRRHTAKGPEEGWVVDGPDGANRNT